MPRSLIGGGLTDKSSAFEIKPASGFIRSGNLRENIDASCSEFGTAWLNSLLKANGNRSFSSLEVSKVWGGIARWIVCDPARSRRPSRQPGNTVRKRVLILRSRRSQELQELQELQNTRILIFFQKSWDRSLTFNAKILTRNPFRLSPELLNSWLTVWELKRARLHLIRANNLNRKPK
jgi:hypothetical protein